VGSKYYCVRHPGECDGQCEICPVSPTKWKARSAQEDDMHMYNENPEWDGQYDLFDGTLAEDKSREETLDCWAKRTITDVYKSEKPTPDAIVKPAHYTKWQIEPINFIMRNNMPFWMGNVVKYCMRADDKNGIEDLRKAIRYIEFRIRQLEGEVEITR